MLPLIVQNPGAASDRGVKEKASVSAEAFDSRLFSSPISSRPSVVVISSVDSRSLTDCSVVAFGEVVFVLSFVLSGKNTDKKKINTFYL